MKISVITAVYNNQNTIEDALNSVLSQTHDDVEYIVIDGNSSDDTLNIIKKYEDKIDVLVSEPDSGIYDALNKGIDKASGDIVCFLHSDDIYANEHVLTKVNALLENSHADSVYGDLVYVKKTNIDKVVRFWKSGEFSEKKLKRGWMPPHPTFFVKREIYTRYGGFDTSFTIAADYDTVLRFLGVQKISTAYLPEVLIKMRLGGESNKSLSNLKKKTLEDIRALKKNNIGGYLTIVMKNISKLPQFFKSK
ncbi:glycosyltransferase [Sulfurimonas sp. SAG-AH-194-C21]|nr:glycosyltransferase family 2 protein [Sulfurimonas sp. SAG-AH-194-C21]MDF1884415.1 glycosyltransferase [Sulfurimonas sp. SAG-AH-194-C21]